MANIITYKGSDGQEEIAIRCTVQDCVNWGGYGVCDTCNKSRLLDTGDEDALRDHMYLCPELGSRALCEQCFEEHKKQVKWYKEDRDFVEETLVGYVNYNNLDIPDADMIKMYEFLQRKSVE